MNTNSIAPDPTTLKRHSAASLPAGGEVYHARQICLTNPQSKTSRWAVSVHRESDGQMVGNFMVIAASARSGLRLNTPGFPGWAKWSECYAALLSEVAQREVAA